MHIQVMRNPDDQQLNLKYKTLRNELASALRNSELKHYSNELELNKSDLHKTWGVPRVIIGKDVNNLKPKLQFQVNDKYVTDSLEVANSFNESFVSIGPKLADKGAWRQGAVAERGCELLLFFIITVKFRHSYRPNWYHLHHLYIGILMVKLDFLYIIGIGRN